MRVEADAYLGRLLLTAPWDPPIMRRGDALGLRGLAGLLAERLAPDMNNRVRDGRWLTVLAWCLARSHAAFHASGGRAIETREQQQERYAWLRPLELMWVARTIELAPEDWQERTLPGRRRVEPWLKHGRSGDRFGMSEDQFRAYRQTGSYGGYRVAFRRWPGMTVGGDGWTPGLVSKGLAQWLDGKLGQFGRPDWRLSDSAGHEGLVSTRSAKLVREDKHRWWLQNWQQFDKAGRVFDENTLPRPRDEFALLPEANLLRQAVFGGDSYPCDSHGARRLRTVRAVAKARAASHLDICKHLARTFPDDPAIEALPRFSRLADAGIVAMELIDNELGDLPGVALGEVARRSDASAICNELMAAARAWLASNDIDLPGIEAVNRFAAAIPSARPVECLSALLHHHETRGGGLRWFVLRNGLVEPRTRPGGSSSRYRFRLWALCRLATQCGVIRSMPQAMRLAESYDAGEGEDE